MKEFRRHSGLLLKGLNACRVSWKQKISASVVIFKEACEIVSLSSRTTGPLRQDTVKAVDLPIKHIANSLFWLFF